MCSSWSRRGCEVDASANAVTTPNPGCKSRANSLAPCCATLTANSALLKDVQYLPKCKYKVCLKFRLLFCLTPTLSSLFVGQEIVTYRNLQNNTPRALQVLQQPLGAASTPRTSQHVPQLQHWPAASAASCPCPMLPASCPTCPFTHL